VLQVSDASYLKLDKSGHSVDKYGKTLSLRIHSQQQIRQAIGGKYGDDVG
jgi:hypothetical protein